MAGSSGCASPSATALLTAIWMHRSQPPRSRGRPPATCLHLARRQRLVFAVASEVGGLGGHPIKGIHHEGLHHLRYTDASRRYGHTLDGG